MSAYVNPDTLFEDEDVSDDKFDDSYRFRAKKRFLPELSAKSDANESHIPARVQQHQDMLQREKEIEQSILDSSVRSIELLRESEAKGIAIAEELVHQGEQLQNIDQNLDNINVNLSYSNNHLNGITSILHGFKNYISRKIDKTLHRSNSSPSQIAKPKPKRSHLNVVINNLPPDNNEDLFHSNPTMRLRGLEAPKSAPVINDNRANEFLDANLDEMVQHITRLKGLGLAIGEEIEQQTDLIDTIQDKAEVADIKIGKQNRRMNKILGK